MRIFQNPFRLLPAALIVVSCLAQAQSAGTLIRAAELKAEPFADAAALVNLPSDAALTVVDSKGGWSKVKTQDGKTGWVRLLNVRLAAGASDTSALASIGGVIRTGTTKSAATTGVKGLSKEDLARAKPNPAEVRKLDAWRAKDGEINRFAAARKLTARDVPELKP